MFIRGNMVKVKHSFWYLHPELKENAVYVIDGEFFNPLGNYMLYFLRGIDLIFRDEDLILYKSKLELE